jgi:double zinc ribbon protein
MTDLERLVRQLVDNLSSIDPARLRQPVTLADVRDSIVPYRANRRALQLESSEDYELVLMRLCAGEGGFARTESQEIAQEFADEVASPNPDLTLIQRREKAVLMLDARALTQATSDPHQAFVPRSAVDRRKEKSRAPKKTVQDATRSLPTQCGRCRANLPVGRIINFCPQCGYDLRRGYCPQCNAALEPEWRHCVSCGTTLSGG